MKLNTLAPGTRFRYPECRKIAVLLSVSESGARVKFEGSDQRVEIEADEMRGTKGATFTRPGQPVLVAAESEVELWPEQSPTTSDRSSSGASTQRARRSRASA